MPEWNREEWAWGIVAISTLIVAVVGTAIFQVNSPTASTSLSVTRTETTTSLTSTYVNGSSGLSLRLGINSTILTTGQNLSVSISDYNSEDTANNMSVASDWPIANLTLYTCGTIGLPIGVDVLSGNYDKGNLSSGMTLQIVEGGIASCPDAGSFNSYLFEPHNDRATFSGNCNAGCGVPFYTSETIAISGYWTGGVLLPDSITPTVLHPLPPGEYTVVGGDEWGNEVILHFVVDG